MRDMLTTRRTMGQSAPPTRHAARRSRLYVGLLLLAIAAASPLHAQETATTDFRIVFDLNAGQSASLEILKPYYADDIAAIEAGSAMPVRIGIGALVAAPADADPARIAENSIWALFDHPNACNAEGCRLVHLYRDIEPGEWRRGFDGYATGELTRLYPFTGLGSLVGCIQMREGAHLLYAWDRESIVRGAHC